MGRCTRHRWPWHQSTEGPGNPGGDVLPENSGDTRNTQYLFGVASALAFDLSARGSRADIGGNNIVGHMASSTTVTCTCKNDAWHVKTRRARFTFSRGEHGPSSLRGVVQGNRADHGCQQIGIDNSGPRQSLDLHETYIKSKHLDDGVEENASLTTASTNSRSRHDGCRPCGRRPGKARQRCEKWSDRQEINGPRCALHCGLGTTKNKNRGTAASAVEGMGHAGAAMSKVSKQEVREIPLPRLDRMADGEKMLGRLGSAVLADR